MMVNRKRRGGEGRGEGERKQRAESRKQELLGSGKREAGSRYRLPGMRPSPPT
jgi:hypothetical protein